MSDDRFADLLDDDMRNELGRIDLAVSIVLVLLIILRVTLTASDIVDLELPPYRTLWSFSCKISASVMSKGARVSLRATYA